MKRLSSTARRPVPWWGRLQRGVSLIELMVGVLIGIVTVLAILQLMYVWDARKRTVASGNDAQVSGTLGNFSIDRDIRLAGHGFGVAASDVMGCTVVAHNSTRSPSQIDFPLQAVQIINNGDAADEVRVLYGNSAYFVANQLLQHATEETKELRSREGFRVGDKVVVANGSDCQLIEVTGLAANADGKNNVIEHKAGAAYTIVSGQNYNATMNPAGGTGTRFTVAGQLYNLGLTPVLNVWRVNRSRATLTRYDALRAGPTSAQDVVNDVVTLKAQYGIDTSGDARIDDSEWTDTAPSGTDWTRVLAVRMALLVRSRQYERPMVDGGTPIPVTPDAQHPRWAAGEFVMSNLDGSSDSGAAAIAGENAPNNWRNYRYRVYESVVPLRNMIWGVSQ